MQEWKQTSSLFTSLQTSLYVCLTCSFICSSNHWFIHLSNLSSISPSCHPFFSLSCWYCFVSFLVLFPCLRVLYVMWWNVAQIASAHLPLYILSLHIFLPPALFCPALSTYQRLVATHSSVPPFLLSIFTFLPHGLAPSLCIPPPLFAHLSFLSLKLLSRESNGASVYDTLKDHTCDVRSKIKCISFKLDKRHCQTECNICYMMRYDAVPQFQKSIKCLPDIPWHGWCCFICSLVALETVCILLFMWIKQLSGIYACLTSHPESNTVLANLFVQKWYLKVFILAQL